MTARAIDFGKARGTPRGREARDPRSDGPDLLDGYPWTDSGNAERLIALHGRDLRYVRTWQKWLTWTGNRWALDDGAVYRAAKATARSVMKRAQAIESEEARKAAIKYALKCEDKRAIEAMVSLARHELAVAVHHDELDRDHWLLNVANGTVELRTGTLRPHARGDLITKLAPVPFELGAPCERFERFLSEVLADDPSLVRFLHHFLGYALTGDVREHILPLWWGSGCNGKSLLALVLQEVLGDYACKAAPELLFRTPGAERHPTELCDLHGRRLVICNETTRGRAWDEATVKDVTGGDRIRARRMREDFWEFTPTHKLVVFGNHKPRIRCVDDAMKRRLRLVPFTVSFEGRQDKTLSSTLLSETSGILRWLVEGCVAWQRDGLPEATAVREATGRYFQDEDALGQFLETECVFVPDAKVARREIRDRYVQWSAEAGEPPVNTKTFAEALRQRGALERQVRTAAGSRRGWVGVRLASDAEPGGGGHVATCGHSAAVGHAGLPSETPNRKRATTRGHVTTAEQTSEVVPTGSGVAPAEAPEQDEKGEKHDLEA